MNNLTLFSQFHFFMALKMLLFRIFNRFLNPYANIFYGFCAEEQVINALLNYPKTGFYVDVGCNHPIRFSNSFFFYEHGWKGLTIDAIPELIDLHKRVRPKDISICCAVSDSEKEVVFTHFAENSLSTISPIYAERYGKTVPIIAEESVTTKTLNSVFEEYHVPSQFQFLSIDVEGHDYEALCGIDLMKYKPKLIIVEILDYSFENYHANKIVKYLEDQNYELVGFYHINGYFKRKGNDHPE